MYKRTEHTWNKKGELGNKQDDDYIFLHDDVIIWKQLPRYWLFVRAITGPRWIPRTKASDASVTRMSYNINLSNPEDIMSFEV